MPVLKLVNAPDGVSGEESYNHPSQRSNKVIPNNTVALVEVFAKPKEITKNFTDDEGNPVVRIEFEFIVVEGDYANKHVWHEVWNEFTDSPKCRLREWAQELLNRPITDAADSVFDTDVLQGTRAWATIGVREWINKDGSTGQRNTVWSLTRVDPDEARPSAPSSDPAEEPF